MAQYAILIYEAEADYANAGQVGERGAKILGGDALEPTTTATSIRGDIVTDGPFVETKEALGGFYLIEAESLDEAIEWAGHIPSARFGTIEVRPVVDRSGNSA